LKQLKEIDDLVKSRPFVELDSGLANN